MGGASSAGATSSAANQRYCDGHPAAGEDDNSWLGECWGAETGGKLQRIHQDAAGSEFGGSTDTQEVANTSSASKVYPLHLLLELPLEEDLAAIQGCPGFPWSKNHHETPDAIHVRLTELYQDFLINLCVGLHSAQLTTSEDYSDVHCQLSEDLQTFTLRLRDGRVVEFRLDGVHTMMSSHLTTYDEHIAIIESSMGRLVFLHHSREDAQRFVACMEMLTQMMRRKGRNPSRNQSAGEYDAVPDEFVAKLLPAPRLISDAEARAPVVRQRLTGS
eukprot:NODE_11986_length_1253_cov_4.432504.p1 GENE.NODE_11986_length_1253_cov_4.432504~~NODE_11986_length_1253_cov_4.432504.p1  ORF type:complete len:316 (-),score=47.88 NODE_11986_length_1253_cov_4.432504:306-1127(-)